MESGELQGTSAQDAHSGELETLFLRFCSTNEPGAREMFASAAKKLAAIGDAERDHATIEAIILSLDLPMKDEYRSMQDLMVDSVMARLQRIKISEPTMENSLG